MKIVACVLVSDGSEMGRLYEIGISIFKEILIVQLFFFSSLFKIKGRICGDILIFFN